MTTTCWKTKNRGNLIPSKAMMINPNPLPKNQAEWVEHPGQF